MAFQNLDPHFCHLPKMQAGSPHSDPWAHLLQKAIDEVQTHEGLLCDIATGLLILLLLSWCFFRRPRTTGSLIVAWLCWFASQLDRGSAVDKVLGHARDAATRTKEAVRAVAEMLVAWVALFVPALHDLCLAGEQVFIIFRCSSWKIQIKVWVFGKCHGW